MADFTAAAATRQRAVMGATHDDKARAWGRREKYCQSIRCSDFYMDGLQKQEKIIMLGAFAAVRSGGFSGECYGTLAEGTVRGTISHVVQAFRAKGRQNLTKDADHKLSILLSRQFHSFQNEDLSRLF
jgi:hypothetical protein